MSPIFSNHAISMKLTLCACLNDVLVAQPWPIGMPHSPGQLWSKDGPPSFLRLSLEQFGKGLAGNASEATVGHSLKDLNENKGKRWDKAELRDGNA